MVGFFVPFGSTRPGKNKICELSECVSLITKHAYLEIIAVTRIGLCGLDALRLFTIINPVGNAKHGFAGHGQQYGQL